MRPLILSVLALGAVYAGGVAPAAARDYPYCLQGPETGVPGDCSYSSYAQCRASASGRLADCNLNPRVAFAGPRGPGGYDRDGYGPPPRGYRGDRYRRGYDDRW